MNFVEVELYIFTTDLPANLSDAILFNEVIASSRINYWACTAPLQHITVSYMS